MDKGSRITSQTRDASYQAILPFTGSIQESVYNALSQHAAGLTAEEVAAEVGCSLNSARSRLTELFNVQRVQVRGKRKNALGTRNIAVWSLPRPAP